MRELPGAPRSPTEPCCHRTSRDSAGGRRECPHEGQCPASCVTSCCDTVASWGHNSGTRRSRTEKTGYMWSPNMKPGVAAAPLQGVSWERGPAPSPLPSPSPAPSPPCTPLLHASGEQGDAGFAVCFIEQKIVENRTPQGNTFSCLGPQRRERASGDGGDLNRVWRSVLAACPHGVHAPHLRGGSLNAAVHLTLVQNSMQGKIRGQ